MVPMEPALTDKIAMSNVVGSIDILLAREASGAADKSPDETKANEMLGYAHEDDQRRS